MSGGGTTKAKDRVSLRLLKNCTAQLMKLFHTIFRLDRIKDIMSCTSIQGWQLLTNDKLLKKDNGKATSFPAETTYIRLITA